MTAQELELIAQEHFYWFHEACLALDKMCVIASDMSETGSAAFAQAKAQFDLARSRCKREFDTLS